MKGAPFLEGSKPISNNPFVSLLNRTWRPTLTITGQTGFPEAEGSGNVNLPTVSVRFSIRMPPTLDGNKAAEKLKEIL